MHKKINTIFALLFILVIVFTIIIFVNQKTKDINNNYNQAAQAINAIAKIPKKENRTNTLFFVGDIMLTRGVQSSVINNFNGDYNKLFENVSELKDADILFGNLEGDVSNTGNNVGSKYSFRMNPDVLNALKNAGFDIVSFANNHVGDWNMNAFKDTLSRLEDTGILKTGAGLNKDEVINPTIIEKNGTKFGFLGFSDVGPNWLKAKDNNPGILLASDPNFGEIIQNAKTKCDVLIVSFHWGEEYKLIHNARQENLAHTAIDNGADMIIGHHPHVMEDTENYNGKPIIYSLGNFIFDQSFSKDTMHGMFFSATYDGKNLIGIEQKIITLNKKYQPEGIFNYDEDENVEVKEKDKLITSSCPKPNKDYEDMWLLNVGQTIRLPDTAYAPKDLMKLNAESRTREGICLKKDTKDSFESLAKDAKKYGYNIKASSGFRGYEYQKNLLYNAKEDDNENAIISVAKPGYSEHQLGTTVDLTGSSINYDSASDNFDGTPEDSWLKVNAYLYGFVQSYPKDKRNITGYRYEPWHYRYVGIKNAKEIKYLGLTISEFLKQNSYSLLYKSFILRKLLHLQDV